MELKSLLSLILHTDNILSITCYDGSSPIDFSSDAEISFTVMRHYGDSAVLSLTKGGGEVSGDANGVVTVTIADNDTIGIAPGTYSWSVMRTDDGGDLTEAGRGRIVLAQRYL